jgi:multiple sugar transport system permease protein
VLIASSTVILALVTSVLAGFAFGILRFPGRRFLMLLVLSVLMMPIVVLIIPDYVLATDVHWVDTYWIQIVPWGASVFGIFLVRQFFITMPQEILDAAAVDGAGRLQVPAPGASFSSANGTDYPALAAAATFTTLPLMVFFLLLQRQFIRGALSAAGSIR